MKLATTTGDFSAYTSDQLEILDYIRQAGFCCADYSFGIDYQHQKGVYGKCWKAYLKRLKEKADALGVTLVQSHAPMWYGTPIQPGEEREKLMAATERAIEACGILGIPNTVVHSGYRQGISREQSIEENIAFYRELMPIAEKHNVKVLTENFNKMCVDGLYWVDHATDLLQIIEGVNHPLLQACWDVGHANMQPMTQSEELKLLGKHVCALHVQDNRGDDDHHVAPFFGTVNLDDLMHGLAAIGYDGYFTFEACSMLMPPWKRRVYEADTRLLQAPLSVQLAAEKLLYEIGRATLDAYHCYEG